MIVVNNLDDFSRNLGSMLTWPCRSWRLGEKGHGFQVAKWASLDTGVMPLSQ